MASPPPSFRFVEEQTVKGKVKGRLAGLYNLLRGLHPAKLVLLGYLSYVVIGWILLSLPFAQRGEQTAASGGGDRPGLGVLDIYPLYGRSRVRRQPRIGLPPQGPVQGDPSRPAGFIFAQAVKGVPVRGATGREQPCRC